MAIYKRTMMFLLSAKAALLYIVTSFIGVLLVMYNTSPIELGPSGMLAAFTVFYVWFFAMLLGVSHVVHAIRHKSDEGLPPVLSGRAVMLSSVWAFAPLVALALQSIGQLDALSIGLVILFEILASIYIWKR